MEESARLDPFLELDRHQCLASSVCVPMTGHSGPLLSSSATALGCHRHGPRMAPDTGRGLRGTVNLPFAPGPIVRFSTVPPKFPASPWPLGEARCGGMSRPEGTSQLDASSKSHGDAWCVARWMLERRKGEMAMMHTPFIKWAPANGIQGGCRLKRLGMERCLNEPPPAGQIPPRGSRSRAGPMETRPTGSNNMKTLHGNKTASSSGQLDTTINESGVREENRKTLGFYAAQGGCHMAKCSCLFVPVPKNLSNLDCLILSLQNATTDCPPTKIDYQRISRTNPYF